MSQVKEVKELNWSPKVAPVFEAIFLADFISYFADLVFKQVVDVN